ncbi:hypothetical protein [Nibribacter koreensis]
MLTYQKNKTKVKPLVLALALYQLLGGLLGLFFLLRMAPLLNNPAPSTWAGLLLAAVLYSFSVVCGFLLMNGKRSAFTLSLANQVLQVFSFGFGGLGYNYVAGVKAGLGLEFLANWLFKFNLSLSSFNFSLGAGAATSFVTVNLLALVLIYLLEKARDEVTAP